MANELCKCGRELTNEEIELYDSVCLACKIKIAVPQSILLGMEVDALIGDPEFYGRTEDEYEQFLNDVEVSTKPTETRTTLKDPVSDFKKSVNKSLKNKVFVDTSSDKVTKIVAYGASEDIKLTFEIPKLYPIDEKYDAHVKKLLGVYLETILHFYAFGPMINAGIEEYLISKYNLNNRPD